MLARYPSPRASMSGSSARAAHTWAAHADLPRLLPLCLGAVLAAGFRHAGVGEEQVNRSAVAFWACATNARISPSRETSRGDRQPPDLVGHGLGRIAVYVGDDHRAGALGGEASRQRASDAATGPGHHHVSLGIAPSRAPHPN